MANEIINIDELNRLAVKYNPTLAQLPFSEFEPRLAALGIQLLEVENELKDVIFERKGGISAPYTYTDVDGVPANSGELGKVIERSLKVEKCFVTTRDHIDNMENKLIQSNTLEVANPISKEHPVKSLIIETTVKTVSEDNLSAIFPGTRDNAGSTPLDMVDGFHKKIADAKVDEEVTVANKNLYSTGAITAENAFSKLKAFVRYATGNLRRTGYIMMTSDSLFKCMDALTAELEKNSLITYDQFIGYLQQQTNAKNLSIVTDECLGTGDQWIYTVKNNFQVGMYTLAAAKFVQIIQPNPKDPNWVGFFTQWKIGTRILQFHPKVFLVNDQLNTAVEMSGDYIIS